MFCENCGNNYGENDKFCIKCGHPVNGQAPIATRQVVGQNERWWHRLATVIYVLAHLPLLAVVPLVWSENARTYSTYYKQYQGSDGEAFWYCFLTILIWVGVLRLIKMAIKYIAIGKKPSFKDILFF